MAIAQQRSRRKASGGRYVRIKGKKLHSLGRLPTFTRVGARLTKFLRVRGGHGKTVVMSEEFVNVLDPKTKKYAKAKIEQVLENQANRHFVRRNILTKGTIVRTSKGKAKISSRPGQVGMINAVLVE